MVQRLHDYQIVWDSQSWKRQSSVSDQSLLIYNVKVCLRHMQCYKNDDLNFHLDSSHRMQIFNFNWKLKLIFEHVSHQSSPASSDFSFAERRSSIFDPDYFRIGSWEVAMMTMVVINWLRRLMWLSFPQTAVFCVWSKFIFQFVLPAVPAFNIVWCKQSPDFKSSQFQGLPSPPKTQSYVR